MTLRLRSNKFHPRSGLISFILLSTFVLLPSGAIAETSSPPAPQQTATVIITDVRFSPKGVTIYAGGSVQWVNASFLPHTVTQASGQSYGLNSGGIGPGSCPTVPGWSPSDCQPNSTFQFSFPNPGTYLYTSAIDCLFGNSPTNPDFDCSPAWISVVPAPSPGTVQASAAPAPAPTATAGPILKTANVTITDSGFSPPVVNLTVGGTVIWTNLGSNVHTAKPLNANAGLFDSGGLATGQTFAYEFVQPGTYVYTSYPDCGPGNNSSVFQCGYFAVLVTPAAATASSNPAPIIPTTPTAVPTPMPTGIPATNTSISIDDVNGFTPASLTIKAGQTVTWTNNGSNVHSAVSNWSNTPLWYLPSAAGLFDSGGLGPGQQFSYTFSQPGVYNYHSSTEPIVTNSSQGTPAPGNTITTYQFNAVITVLP